MLSAMRPHDERYTSFPLPGQADIDATLSYLLLVWPVLDPYARYLFVQETGDDRLVRATEDYFLTPEAMQEGNPQLILERGEEVYLPPVLIVQGTADESVPLAVSERFAEVYRDAGGLAELELFPGMPHRFARTPGEATDRAIELMKAFTARQLAQTAAYT